jgi:DNA repair protein RecN (Recombination protein N)
MLRLLRIRDFALIDSLEIELGEGLCLLTGETGAGKSILVEAVGLLTGDRAESEMIRSGAEEASVEGLFACGSRARDVESLLAAWQMPFEGDEVLLRRRLLRSGRSTATVNGAGATLGQLREVGALLVQIHGQHQSQSLLDEESHGALLDALPSVAPRAKATAEAHALLAEAMAAWRALSRTQAERAQRLDTLRFQREELDRVNPKPGEEEELNARRSILQNAEQIVSAASALAALLRDGDPCVAALLREGSRHLADLASMDPSWEPFRRDLDGAGVVLSSIAEEAERTASTVAFDSEALEQTLARLADLGRLKRKYGPSLEDVLAHRERVEEEYRTLASGPRDVGEARKRVEEAYASFLTAARSLSKARAEAAPKLASAVENELRPLAMEKARFVVALEPVPGNSAEEARPTGLESVRFLFSANPGESLKALSKIASGGELSRTLLALLTASRAGHGAPVQIFDEVDAGIGGRPAERVGRRLRDLAAKHQVLCITHLPQIAAFAHRHVKVEKQTRGSRTVIRAALLSDKERREELARMLAGETVTDTALRHAAALLESAKA